MVFTLFRTGPEPQLWIQIPTNPGPVLNFSCWIHFWVKRTPKFWAKFYQNHKTPLAEVPSRSSAQVCLKMTRSWSQILLNVIQNWIIVFRNFSKLRQNSVVAIKPKLREYCEVLISFCGHFLQFSKPILRTAPVQGNWEFRELCLGLILKELKAMMEMYQFPLMLFPFLVELLLFCSAFCTIKIKAFEVSEFAYFIFFQRLCHSLLWKW